jgi:hypothetical protein
VIPILEAKVAESNPPPNAYGNPVWQGAYVFDISLYHNLVLEGRITHLANGASIYNQEYWVTRSLYIENVLYTVSDRMIKMNSLEDMSQMGQIPLS